MNQIPVKTKLRPELEYPFEKKWSPQQGEPFEVADGVFWLRVPLPIELDHINLWLIRDSDDSWTIVDSGYDAQVCKDAWDKVFDGFFSPESVKRIIITHFHPDHIGLAAWLAHRCDCEILISEGEFRHYNDILQRDKAAFSSIALDFALEIGFDEKLANAFAGFFSADDKPKESRVQESMCRFIADNDEIDIGGHTWRVVSGNGHSPEHSCLHCPELDLMISGDQSIPRISSNVSVYPSNRHANPLGDWIDSCIKLRDNIPDNTLVLPAHQEPFKGIKQRMQQLIDDHNDDLQTLRKALLVAMSPVDARKVLFDRKLNLIQTVLATGETLAHLNYLVHSEEVVMTLQDGVAHYQLASQS